MRRMVIIINVQDDLSAIFDRIANGKETEGHSNYLSIAHLLESN
jgi:hypothetical protein